MINITRLPTVHWEKHYENATTVEFSKVFFLLPFDG